jgi:hypothetical protein
MPTIMTEKVHALEVVLSEANGHRSRDTITLKSGRAYEVGDVLGKITSEGADKGKYKLVDNQTPATDGSQNAVAVLLYDVDASLADAEGVVFVRDAEVKAGYLNYAANTTHENKALANAALAALGIVPRGGSIAEPSAPDIFESGDWSAAGGVLKIVVTVSSLPFANGSPITDIEYKVGAGSWVSSGGITSFEITGQTAGAKTVALRAKNAVGVGVASATKNATVTAE